jgi:type III pantothenate kinase
MPGRSGVADPMQRAILINLGNTHCQLAAWAAGRLGARERCPTAALREPGWTAPLLAAHPGWPLVIASVVPAARDALAQAAGERPLHWLIAAADTGLDFSAVDPTTLGADRVANALAAAHHCPLPAIVVDCGTAITTEVVSADRRFLGGAILPGRALARRALHTGTGQLPAIPLEDDCPAALGRNTRDALRAGIDLGLLGAVRHLVQESSRALGGAGLPALAVGGDRHFFARHLDLLQAGDDDFTLHGLAAWAARL